jgi:hypothetical protein
MTVSVTQVGALVRLSGTIAEVLAEIQEQRLDQANNIIWYSDDNTDAKALCSRRE